MMRRFTSTITAAAFLAALRPAGAGAQAPLDHRELAADQQITHALNRLTFGARPGDVQKVRAMGLDSWIEKQLDPKRIDNEASDRVLSRYSVLRENQNDLLREYNVARAERRMDRRADSAQGRQGQARKRRIAASGDDPQLNRRAVVAQLQSARVARAVSSERQLEEVMTDFWLNHFNVFAQKGGQEPYYIADYERTAVRPHALGKFRDLLGAVAKSPAMLFYLDNARSMGDSSKPRLATVNRRQRRRIPQNQQAPVLQRLRNGGLNENYGRELLELHTLGVDGGYTQQDVIDVARALTGWTIRPPATGGGFVFRPEMHDAGEKTVLGTRLKAGRGIEEGEQVLDIVARHPSTAKYIARKLAVRFVSDSPPEALVNRAAEVFLRTDGDIREVVRTIITSNEFYSRSAFRSKVKSPFEVVVSALRAMNAAPDSTPRTAQVIAYLGQPIYGHQAPNGYPETGDAWMNTGAILNRINFGIAAAANRIPGASIASMPGIDSLRNATRPKQVDAVTTMLLGGSISPETRSILISGENPLLARAGAAEPDMSSMTMDDDTMRPRANPLGRRNGAPVQLTGIAQVVGLAIGSPEFQRR
jgi:uncharacterized protein (DUF1800 family)